jgi:hypothetical protein
LDGVTTERAKQIINSYGAPVNIAEHIEAINVALRVLGGKATMAEIWRWAKNDKDSDNDTP